MPERLPETFYWFKWEAYTTWLSGFALITVVYYAHARASSSIRPWPTWTTGEAIALSIGGLALAWIVYDSLCRAVSDERLLAVLIAAFVVLAARAAPLRAACAHIQVGATLEKMAVYSP